MAKERGDGITDQQAAPAGNSNNQQPQVTPLQALVNERHALGQRVSQQLEEVVAVSKQAPGHDSPQADAAQRARQEDAHSGHADAVKAYASFLGRPTDDPELLAKFRSLESMEDTIREKENVAYVTKSYEDQARKPLDEQLRDRLTVPDLKGTEQASAAAAQALESAHAALGTFLAKEGVVIPGLERTANAIGAEVDRTEAHASAHTKPRQGPERAHESGAFAALREERQREAREALAKRFHQSGDVYYYKNEIARVAFSDRGQRLVTQAKDPTTVDAMVLGAEAKGWSTIKVTGSEEFRRVAWLEASARGIAVKGYQPKEVDVAALDIKREQRARNGLEGVMDHNKVRDEPTLDAVKQVAKSKQRSEDYNLERPSSGASAGGGTKAKIVEAVASAVVTAKIKNPAVRARVMGEVTRQLEKRSARGKQPPVVHKFDKSAPTKVRDTERSRPPIERNTERTR